jgi:hypothetical protein
VLVDDSEGMDDRVPLVDDDGVSLSEILPLGVSLLLAVGDSDMDELILIDDDGVSEILAEALEVVVTDAD